MANTIRVFSTRFTGNPQGIVLNLPMVNVGWARNNRRIAGYSDGKFTLRGTDQQLKQWFGELLGYEVREQNTWEGFIWGMALTINGVTRRISYDNIYNAVAVAYGEAVENGGFEFLGGAGSSPFTNWDQFVGGGGAVNVETTLINSGINAAYIEAGASRVTRIWQDITVTAGESFVLTFYNAGDNNPGGSGNLGGRFRVSNTAETVDYIPLSSTLIFNSVYRKVERSFTVPAGETTVRITLQCPNQNNRAAYFDDVSLRLVDEQGNEIKRLTLFATNDQSINRHGRRELIVTDMRQTPTTAAGIRDTTLSEKAWAKVSNPQFTDGGDNRLEVDVVGYWATAFFRYLTVGNWQTEQLINELITDIVTTDCDWIELGAVRAATDKARINPLDRKRAGNVLVELTERGDMGTIQRMIVSQQRRLTYELVDKTPIYFRRDGLFYNRAGGKQRVDPFQVQGGVVARDEDFGGQSAHYEGYLLANNDFILEDVEVNAMGEIRPTSLNLEGL